jgi:hypothetical protein
MASSSICSIKRVTLLLKVFVQQLVIVQCTFLLNFSFENKSLQLHSHTARTYVQVVHVSVIREHFLLHIAKVGSRSVVSSAGQWALQINYQNKKEYLPLLSDCLKGYFQNFRSHINV